MSEGARQPDLNSERVFRHIEATKVYLLKVTFNLRTLIYNAPKSRKFKNALKRYERAAGKMEEADISAVPDKTASELIYQYYRFKGLNDVYTKANEDYLEYYDDLMLRLKKLKRIKTYAGWKLMSAKRKQRIYDDTKEINRVLRKDYLEDMNRLLFNRARVLGAKKQVIWNEYRKDPEAFTEGLDEYI